MCVTAADSNYHHKPLVAPAGGHPGGEGEKGREERAVRYLGFRVIYAHQGKAWRGICPSGQMCEPVENGGIWKRTRHPLKQARVLHAAPN